MNKEVGKITQILKENDLGVTCRNISFFENKHLDNDIEVNETIDKIKEYEHKLKNSSNKYPEYIMKSLRQRQGLDEYDMKLDNQLNKMEVNEVFAEVLKWNGLSGWDYQIKDWIRDIYGVDLDEI